MKRLLFLPALLLAVLCSAAEQLVFTAGSVDSSGQPTRRLECIKTDGTGRFVFDIRVRNHENIFAQGMRNYDPVAYHGTSIYEVNKCNWKNVKSVLHPDVSPVGKYIIFRNTYTIHGINWDGSGYVNLTPYAREWNLPRFSHDGKKIAMVADIESNSDIYTMNYDGSGLKNVAPAASAELCPYWSPDNSELVFISNRNGKFELFIMSEDGKNTRRILSMDGDIREPVWSSKNEIAFALQKPDGKSSLWKVSPDGKNLKQLTDGKAWDGQPAWNSAGTLLAFASNRSGRSNIWLLDVASGKIRNVTKNTKEEEYSPCFVPKQIADKPFVVETANIKGVPLPRPRLLFHKSDIPGLRTKFSKAPYKRSWESFLRNCNKYTGVDSKARKDLLNRIRTGANFAKITRDLGFAAQITGDAKYGKAGAEILAAGVTRLLLYKPGSGAKDKDLAYSFDWLESYLKPEDRKVVVSALTHFVKNQMKHIQGYYFSNPALANCALNFATYELAGGCMALAVEGEAGADSNALNCFIRVAEENGVNWMDENGGCKEGFSYFLHPVNEALPFLVSLKLNKLAPKAYQNRFAKFPKWMAMCAVNGHLPNLDDADKMAVHFPPGFLKLYPENKMLWKLWHSLPRAAAPKADPVGLLWFEPGRNEKQSWKELPGMCYFPSSNLAVFREENRNGVMLMTFKESGGGHSHNECGGITLQAFGRDLLTDPGQAIRDADKHSQLLIDGRGRLPAYNQSSRQKLAFAPVKGGGSIGVKLPEAFVSGVLFHVSPDYAMPCPGIDLRAGNRVAVKVDGSKNVPSYFLLHDTAALRSGKAPFEQIFISDPDMIAEEKTPGNVVIKEARPEFYWAFADPEKKGTLTARFTVKKSGNYQLYAFSGRNGRYNFRSTLMPGNRRLNWRVSGRITRGSCWQWIQVFKKVNLKAGQHELRIHGEGNIAAIAFVPEKVSVDVFSGKPEGIVVNAKDMVRQGDRWVKGDRKGNPQLQILQFGRKNTFRKEVFSYRTRFYGQVLIHLNRIRFRQTGNDADFVTVLYPNITTMPEVKGKKTSNGFTLTWSNGAVDKFTIRGKNIVLERKAKGSAVEKRTYLFDMDKK